METFYHRAANALEKLDARQGSLNALAVKCARKQGEASRIVQAVSNVLSYRPVLEQLYKALENFAKKDKNLEKNLTKLLLYQKQKQPKKIILLFIVYDLVFGKRGLALPQNGLNNILSKYSLSLKAEKEKFKVKQNVSDDKDLAIELVSKLPVRWLRVNELRWTMQDALDWLENENWTQVDTLENVSNSSKKVYCRDKHVPNLLAFPRKCINLTKFTPYLENKMIAQDKASCLPPLVLLSNYFNVELSKTSPIHCIDATAAPGNKTTMLSAILSKQNTNSTLIAFERDNGRLSTLKKMCQNADCRNTSIRHADFLSIDYNSSDLSKVTHILVDPSCSGSGISDRVESTTQVNKNRLESLAKFQVTILSHALRFPNAKKVVYSTCSLHEEENENVVRRVLDKREFQEAGWKLERALPSWTRRGLEGSDPDAKLMIRCEPGDDYTNGFFVACFIKGKDDIEEEKSNLKRRHSVKDDKVNGYDNDAFDEKEEDIQEQRSSKKVFRGVWSVKNVE